MTKYLETKKNSLEDAVLRMKEKLVGGQREFVKYLSRAATAIGIASVFLETHQDPDNAPSDGPNMIPLSELENIIHEIVQIDDLIKNKK